jgi:DNA-binding response OmpR family regulator
MDILVVDDDLPSMKHICFLLEESGHHAIKAYDGSSALLAIEQDEPDLVLLDVSMPKSNGFDLCRKIRSFSDVAIIFVSARSHLQDRVMGLQIGGDDYLVKPFEPSELLARIDAVMRRRDSEFKSATGSRLSLGDMTLDRVTRTVQFADSRIIELTPLEFRLLSYLMKHAGKVRNSSQILSKVWGYDYEGESNLVSVYIRRLRTKLEYNPEQPRIIVTVRNEGYKFEIPVDTNDRPAPTTNEKTINHAQEDSVTLSLRFVPGNPMVIIWELGLGGSVHSHFSLPLPEGDIALLLRALDAVQWPGNPMTPSRFSQEEQTKLVSIGLSDGSSIVSDIDRRIGQLLYQAIIADPVAHSALDNARNMATSKGHPLALTLHFPHDGISLAALPWELLWDERQPLLLSRSKLSSCVRYIDLFQPLLPSVSTSSRLRLLAVCPSAGIPDELHEEEQQIRAEALQPLIDTGVLVTEELRPAYISALTDRIQDGEAIDVLHFYGHGLWKNGCAYLQFDDGLLSASQLAALLGDIPLVVLHACRSGSVGSDDLFTGIAPMLSAEGIPMVVAMQFTVRVDAALRFSSVLYRNLAIGKSLQTAVAKARQALFVQYRESWYVPVVYIRSHDPHDQQLVVLVTPSTRR